MAKKYGNSNDNEDVHHLYGILDKEDNDLVKYGISSDPIGDDGLSDRVRNQVNLFNAIAGTLRFIGKIILTGIKGRKEAKDIENKYIDDYKKEHGQKLRGNRR